MWRKITTYIQETLFPVFCVACNAEGTWWCEQCKSGTAPAHSTSCFMCGAPAPEGKPCHSCSAHSHLDSLYAQYEYTDTNAVGTLVRLFKYQHARDIAREWRFDRISALVGIGTIVVPVPLHARRQRERGYNQAQLIAQSWAATHGTPIDERMLARVRYTSQQARLGRPERFSNIKDAFVWQGTVCPEHIILVDDIFTTGATLQECARVAKAAGVRRVDAVVLARAKSA